jgi:protein phosphatase
VAEIDNGPGIEIQIPEFALVVLMGASGSGKSTFARTHFLPTEILSSDVCRGLVSDDENDQKASDDAFAVLHFIAARRLANMRLTVIDATNVQPESRRALIDLARKHHAMVYGIAFDLPEALCRARNAQRPDRTFGDHVIRRHRQQLRRSLPSLQREGFRRFWVIRSEAEAAAVRITRTRLWNDRRELHGPFDIIGDVHGCYDELRDLLAKLGYTFADDAHAAPPPGRTAIFLGDLVDRGPNVPAVLRLVMNMVAEGNALCIPGNHDVKLVRALGGRKVEVKHGLEASLEQLAAESDAFRSEVAAFLDGLVSHFVLDDGKLVVAHAGMKPELAGRTSPVVRDFALYGETTGETDEFGLPVRYNWAGEYRGTAMVVYGHTPVPAPEWLNRTINIDTGCVFGGALTALRYPERELVSVPAQRTYAEPARPFLQPAAEAPALSAQQRHDEVLDIADVTGKRYIETRLGRTIQVRAEQAAAALEVMSRFAVNPRWLIYLPPTMSPTETSALPGILEHPAEAFAYYRSQGVPAVICEEKHMGSRAVVVLCRDEDAALRRFGVQGEGAGICYTRTGRRFFDDPALEQALLGRVRSAANAAGLWEQLQSDWLLLDCELMPWSAKAQGLLQSQYAAVGAAGRVGLEATVASMERALTGGAPIAALLEEMRTRRALVEQYVDAYRRYCWEVTSVADLKLAPFHLLASEGVVHIDKEHRWHMETLAVLCAEAPDVLLATPNCSVELADESSCAAATAWWEAMTEAGGEGMVVKPLTFLATGPGGLVQPAVKCRGREYLRIIYGPEYTRPDQLERLRSRGLGVKRGLAAREFALGIEGLERFVAYESLRRVHECVAGVLAMESEPVDPRL